MDLNPFVDALASFTAAVAVSSMPPVAPAPLAPAAAPMAGMTMSATPQIAAASVRRKEIGMMG